MLFVVYSVKCSFQASVTEKNWDVNIPNRAGRAWRVVMLVK